jgi:hypothetical protein
MEQQQHKLKKGQRVRLKADGQDSLYSMACAGSEGWIRKQDIDPLGYPMIYIEWDKNHWAYNGEQDRWTFESHFDPVEENDMSDQQGSNPPPEFVNFMNSMWQQFQASQTPEPQAEEPPPLNEPESRPDGQLLSDEEFAEALAKSVEVAKESDAFILITVDRSAIPDSSVPLLSPSIITCYRTAESGHVAELHMARFVAFAMESLSIDKIHSILQDKDQ